MSQFNFQSFINNLITSDPIFINNQVVFIPLISLQKPQLNYISLEQAHKLELVEIREVDVTGEVQSIFINNKSDKYILIPQGETLIGAKQNRIVNTSILLKPESETKIPVSCIESGRWNYRSPKFELSEEIVAYKLRKHALGSVSRNIIENDSFTLNQVCLWNFIDKEFRKDKMYSRTSSYTDYMKEKLNLIDIDFDKIKFPPETNGFSTFFGTTIFSIEYFSIPEVFNNNQRRLLKALLVDALDYSNIETSKTFNYKNELQIKMKELSNLNFNKRESISAGIDIKAFDESKNLNLSLLIVNDEVLHFVSYF